jgi:uncharacterized protein (TIGR03067 family)
MTRHAVVLTIGSLFAGVSLLSAAGEAKEDAVKKDLEALKGTWAVVSAERDGKKFTDDQLKGVLVTFDADGKVSVQRQGQPLFEGTVMIDPTKKPKTIDATQTSEGDNKGKTAHGIYEIEGDTLKICSAEFGKERPSEFSSKPGSGHFLRVYKREKK